MGNCKSVNRNSDKTITNLDLTTIDNVTRDSFQKHNYKTFRLYCGFLSESCKQNHDITDINRIQEYTFNVGITLEAATSGRHWGRVGYWGKREREEEEGGGGGGELGLKGNADWRREG